MKSASSITARWLLLLSAYLGLSFGQAVVPSLTLTSHTTAAWETEESSVDLRGRASFSDEVSAVTWVNQVGQRGQGTWTTAGNQADWSLVGIPLRLGINQIAVTVTDVKNKSKSLHVAVSRKVPPGTQPARALAIRTGVFQNHSIVYQVWNGMAVVEGDIILNLKSLERRDAAAAKQSVSPNGLSISYRSQLWPAVGGVYHVPYVITGSSANLTTAINTFNSQFSGLIQFVARTSETHYVNITVESGGGGSGFSSVGMTAAGEPQTLDCGGGCTVATWLHEMGHTVGLLHEHQRPDRASYITLNLANADLPNVPGNFTLFSFDYQTLGLYDYASVMHYGAFDFSKAGLPVIESIPAGIPLGNTSGYSAGDMDQIQRLYSFIPAAVTVTTNPSGLGIVVDGTAYTAPHSFNWTLGSTHTINVAADPQQTSPADGSTYAFGNWNDLGTRSHTITVAVGAGTLAAPASKPAVTVYEANFIRLQPFAFQSPSVYPSTAGTVSPSPAPVAEFGGSFYTDRTLVTLTLTATPSSGYYFYDWFNLPYPPADNPHRFYIQSPLTQVQAVFVSTPVTVIGESITGPNTWNPGLSSYVDGAFTFLPAAFSSVYDGAAWNAGTVHSINMPQTQSPVTTNVFYNWNNWSDGEAITHNITQPASGSQTIAASVTPFYASYTVPPPLGGANSACYGGVTTSPAGVSYPANTAFGFYGDGASVTSTATANTIYPGMAFTGWSGSLSGVTNPLATTIHDQFVPTALFNIAAAPLTITSLNPSSVPSNSAAIDITIHGTGFTPTATIVYWNGISRSATYVSSTQLTLHLNAGDVATAGGQDIYIGNYSTSASQTTCGVSAETSFTVITPLPPTVVSLSPSSGSGAAQSFTAVYSDPNGIADLKSVYVLFNTSVNGANACYVQYNVAANALYLENNAGTGTSSALTPGSAGSVSNSQCTLAGSGSSVSSSGNNLTVTYALTFSGAFTGSKNIYLLAIGNSSNSAWIQKGTWTPLASTKPAVVSLSPSSGSGATQAFTAVYSDPNGIADLTSVYVLFNTSVNGANACYVQYNLAASALYLENNAGNGTSSALTPGSGGSVSNSQCTLAGSGSSISSSGNNLTVTYALTFSGTFTGSKNVYLLAVGNGGNSAWIQKGTWTPLASTKPGIVSLSPSSGSGATQSFTAVYSDPNGIPDLKNVYALFNTSVNGANACYVQYNLAANALYLENNGNGTSSALTPGSAGSVSNSQCTLAGSGSSVSSAGNNLAVTYALTFSGTFTGLKNVYLLAVGNSSNSAWIQKGTWTP